MSIVPYTWLLVDNKKNIVRCLWPINIGSDKALTRAVVNKDSFEQHNCKICDIIIKFKTNDYEKAVSKLKSLECQSSLSSAPSDEEGSNRRKVKKNSRYMEFTEESLVNKSNFTPKRKVMRQPLQSDSSEDETNVPSVPPLTQRSCSMTPRMFSQANRNGSNSFKDMTSSSIPSVLPDENITPSTTLTNEPEPIYSLQQMFKMLKRVETLVGITNTKLEILSSDMKHLSRLVQFRENMVEENAIVSSFPITSKEKLIELDEALKNEQTFSEICTSLSIVEGKDCNETVRKILTKILTHEMALSFNWSGRNNKNEFKNFKQLIKLILGVARKNPYSRNATQQDVETIIKQWLRSAPDRLGGRERRRTKLLPLEDKN